MEKQKAVLTGEDCMQVVRDLARSQGSYQRMLSELNELDDEQREDVMKTFEAQEFTSEVDFVVWLES